jgi:hypothetical protein
MNERLRIIAIPVIGLLPLATVAISLFLLRNMFVAMLMMHFLGMIVPAALFAVWRDGAAGLRWYALYLRQQSLGRFGIGPLAFFLGGSSVSIGLYVLSSCKTRSWSACIGGVNNNIAQFGFQEAPVPLAIACGIYFSVVNPTIEELFWRVFMLKETAAGKDTGNVAVSQSEVDLLISPSMEAGIPVESSVATQSNPSWTMRIWLSSLYASYHTLVAGAFLGGVVYGFLSFFVLMVLGIVLIQIFIHSGSSNGFYRAVFLHAGIDLGVAIALGDAVGWYNLVS